MQKDPRRHRGPEREDEEEDVRGVERCRRRSAEKRRAAPSEAIHPRQLAAQDRFGEMRLQRKEVEQEVPAHRNAGAEEIAKRQEREKKRPEERKRCAETCVHGRTLGRARNTTARSDATEKAPPVRKAGFSYLSAISWSPPGTLTAIRYPSDG